MRGLILCIRTHSHVLFFFFFQAEDGIRDYKVTGVQTCALPIFPSSPGGSSAGQGNGRGAALSAVAIRTRAFGSTAASPATASSAWANQNAAIADRKSVV